jgi:hypothetical protein
VTDGESCGAAHWGDGGGMVRTVVFKRDGLGRPGAGSDRLCVLHHGSWVQTRKSLCGSNVPREPSGSFATRKLDRELTGIVYSPSDVSNILVYIASECKPQWGKR